MDARGAPEGVCGGHAGDESLDLGVDGRATSGRAGREVGPILAEPAPLPSQDGVWGHDHEGVPPPGPDPGQPDPEKPVRRTKLGPSCRSLVDGELLAQSQVLDGELAVAAEEEGEEPNQVEQESDHQAEIGSRSAPDQPLSAGRGFGERQRGRGSRPSPVLTTRWRPASFRRPGCGNEPSVWPRSAGRSSMSVTPRRSRS